MWSTSVAASHRAAALRRLRLCALLLALPVGLGGCTRDMKDQPKHKTFSASAFHEDGAAARPLPQGTVARGHLRADHLLYAGLAEGGKFTTQLPLPVTAALLARGRERYDIFCSPCHDRLGNGRGMIVRRGFKQPPSFHIERLRGARPGYLFDVATNGFGQMSGYASQVSAEDRWAIVAYIRALQLSQYVELTSLAPTDSAAVMRAILDQQSQSQSPAASPTGEHGAARGDHGAPGH